MKTLGVAFSARREGNCLKCLRYCLERLKERGYETELINAYDHRITPCNHCGYECFSSQKGERPGQCPLQDDVPWLYKKCKESDLSIFAIPTYGGHLSGLYMAFGERGQSQFSSWEEFQQDFSSKLNLIIIGNLSSGGDMALHEALSDFYNLNPLPETLLLSAREWGRDSLKGDLVEEPELRGRLSQFVDLIDRKGKLKKAGPN